MRNESNAPLRGLLEKILDGSTGPLHGLSAGFPARKAQIKLLKGLAQVLAPVGKMAGAQDPFLQARICFDRQTQAVGQRLDGLNRSHKGTRNDAFDRRIAQKISQLLGLFFALRSQHRIWFLASALTMPNEVEFGVL